MEVLEYTQFQQIDLQVQTTQTLHSNKVSKQKIFHYLLCLQVQNLMLDDSLHVTVDPLLPFRVSSSGGGDGGEAFSPKHPATPPPPPQRKKRDKKRERRERRGERVFFAATIYARPLRLAR